VADLVEPYPKPEGRSPQRERRRKWEADYRKAREVAKKRSNGVCEVCRKCAATSTHHKAGRVGADVNDPEMLLRVCVWCDHKITTEPAWAKAQGFSVDRTNR
jgi:hypothetical protein